ncbi:MAG: DtxR family Mn-dependent transcriptional regulator [Polaribacter sp.]|jgi:DtxR family Mn-dependent transcriptional regulator
MKTELSYTEENYLKAIFSLSKKRNTPVSTNHLAEKLETKPSSITDMVKRLADKKLVDYTKYQGASLTEKGKKTAISTIRNHRLWEVFLVDKLDFKWDEVHDLAEQLEHIKSDHLIDRLDSFLNHPIHDPHGDPIPDKDGNLHAIEKSLLSSFKEQEVGICVGVEDSSSEFLRFLDKQGIALGQKIEIMEKEPFDGSITIKINKKIISISIKIADNLYLQKQ